MRTNSPIPCPFILRDVLLEIELLDICESRADVFGFDPCLPARLSDPLFAERALVQETVVFFPGLSVEEEDRELVRMVIQIVFPRLTDGRGGGPLAEGEVTLRIRLRMIVLQDTEMAFHTPTLRREAELPQEDFTADGCMNERMGGWIHERTDERMNE